jgi:hypothetical protein
MTRSSIQSVTTEQWHEVQAHLTVDAGNPTAGQIEVGYDGGRLADPTSARNFGSTRWDVSNWA